MNPFKKYHRKKIDEDDKRIFNLAKPVAKQFEEFMKCVDLGNLDKSSNEYIERRRTFYAAFYSAFETIKQIAWASENTDESEDVAAEQLNALEKEIHDFHNKELARFNIDPRL